MCGLCGVAGHDMWNTQREVFNDLLVMSSLRGLHGTGVASVSNSDYKPVVDWVKFGGHVYDLMSFKAYDRVTTTQAKMYMGHCRHATQGEKTNANAHPFDFKHVIGCHNGTIQPYSKKKLTDADKFETDSEAIFNDINANLAAGQQYMDALETTVAVLDGAWALTFLIKPLNRLVFIRNKERTLYYCYSKGRKHLFWASELWMLHGAMSRKGIEMEAPPILLRENTALSWVLPKKDKEFDAPDSRVIEGYKPTWSVANSTDSGYPYGTKEWWDEKEAKDQNIPFEVETAKKKDVATTHIGTSSTAPESSISNVAFLRDRLDLNKLKKPYKYPDGTVMTKPEFTELIKRGHVCVYCNVHTPVWGEPVLFLPPDPRGAPQYACKNCLSDDRKVQIIRAIR